MSIVSPVSVMSIVSMMSIVSPVSVMSIVSMMVMMGMMGMMNIVSMTGMMVVRLKGKMMEDGDERGDRDIEIWKDAKRC